jgi:hypothetical protein
VYVRAQLKYLANRLPTYRPTTADGQLRPAGLPTRWGTFSYPTPAGLLAYHGVGGPSVIEMQAWHGPHEDIPRGPTLELVLGQHFTISAELRLFE